MISMNKHQVNESITVSEIFPEWNYHTSICIVKSRIDSSKKLKVQNSSCQYALKAERLKGQ